ncbi:MAG: cytochrome c oxidase subunit II [Planctomycetes bacterium]|nr:cytochrome c oxidase subunit II [Planctomycetota bacterium]
MIEAASDIAREVDYAIIVVGGICAVFFLGIVAFMLLCIFKFHHTKTTKTKQIHGNLFLEITWTVIPTILVFYMFWVGWQGFNKIRTVPDDHMVIEVVAQQWLWNLKYPEEDIQVVNNFHIPAGVPVKFKLTSLLDDVLHSFYIPAFRVKEDCVPGMNTYIWVNADMPKNGESETYNMFCAEFCGKDHAQMIGTVTVDSPAAYEKWVQSVKAEANKPVDMKLALDATSPEVQGRDGETLYKTYCVSCHGSTGMGQAETMVPNARDFTNLVGWKQGNKINNIYETLITGVPGTEMRGFTSLSPWDRFAVAHKVASFYKGSGRQKVSEAEAKALEEKYKLSAPYEPKKTLAIDQAMDLLLKEKK